MRRRSFSKVPIFSIPVRAKRLGVKTHKFCILTITLLAMLFLYGIAIAQNMPTDYKTQMVKTPDGLSISVQDWGNPNGPEILFIHGFAQSY